MFVAVNSLSIFLTTLHAHCIKRRWRLFFHLRMLSHDNLTFRAFIIFVFFFWVAQALKLSDELHLNEVECVRLLLCTNQDVSDTRETILLNVILTKGCYS